MNKDTEIEFTIKAFKDEISQLKSKIQKLTQVINDNGLSDQVEIANTVSDEEQICLDGIGHLKELFKNGTYDKNDVTNFDILHKNLRTIRNQPVEKKRGKVDVKKALAIVEGYKDK